MSKSQSKTFVLDLKGERVALLSINAFGIISDVEGRSIEITDSHGYLIAAIHLAMDVTNWTLGDATHTGATPINPPPPPTTT